MEKEFIPYEQALALKELGFDEYCLGLYSYASRNTIDMQHVIHTCKASSKLIWMRVPTPTYSQVFRWFRGKYELHSTITSISQESWQWHITKPGESLGKLYDEDFYTYEEAELECLKKLIEICRGLK